jgi:chitosanase
MTLSSNQKERIVQAINVFETGSIDGEYDNISIYADGINNSRQVTYGRSQTTEQGNLKDLLKAYIENNGRFSEDFKPYLPKFGVTPLANDTDFHNLLKKAAQEDETMRTTQDAFFDKHYFQKAVQFAKDNGFSYPLSMLVIYDSYIHSGGILQFLRNRFPESPPVRGGDEKAWVKAYTDTRHDWLISKGGILAQTIYRTQCFKMLMIAGDWTLANPISANGSMTRGLDDEPAFEAVKLSSVERAELRGNEIYMLKMY